MNRNIYTNVIIGNATVLVLSTRIELVRIPPPTVARTAENTKGPPVQTDAPQLFQIISFVRPVVRDHQSSSSIGTSTIRI